MNEKLNQDYSKDNGSRGSINESDLRGDATPNHNEQETALEEKMQTLSMDTDDYDDDDFNPSASSRPPPEPFAINDYSEEDDAYEFLDIRRLPGFEQLLKARNNLNPDVRFVLQYVDANFLRYGGMAMEAQKWNLDSEDFLGFESNVDSDTSYSP